MTAIRPRPVLHGRARHRIPLLRTDRGPQPPNQTRMAPFHNLARLFPVRRKEAQPARSYVDS